MSLPAFLGRVLTHYDAFRNMTVSVHGAAPLRVDDWLQRHLPAPHALPGVSAEYFVRPAGRPPHPPINNSGSVNSGSYYCALLCLVSRDRAEREPLVVEIVTHKLGHAHIQRRYANAQTFYDDFQTRVNELVREEKEPRRASVQPA